MVSSEFILWPLEMELLAEAAVVVERANEESDWARSSLRRKVRFGKNTWFSYGFAWFNAMSNCVIENGTVPNLEVWSAPTFLRMELLLAALLVPAGTISQIYTAKKHPLCILINLI